VQAWHTVPICASLHLGVVYLLSNGENTKDIYSDDVSIPGR